jgi:hypothetical protein
MKKRILPFLMLMLLTGVGFAQTHTIVVTVPDSTNKCFITGDLQNWSPWTNDTMTRISVSPKKYSYQFTMADTLADKVNFKVLSGPDWKYQQKRSANFVFKTDSNSAVVDTFEAYYRTSQAKDLTIDVLVPATVFSCYLTGTFANWQPSDFQMTKVDSTANGKEFKLTIHALDTTTLEYKFIAGPGWAYEQSNATNFNYMHDGGTVVCDAFKAIYDPKKVGNITINVTVPPGTPAVWILGSYNNWSLDGAIEATKNADGTYTAVVPMVQNLEYKVWNYPDWPYEEAKDSLGNSLDANRTASFETDPVVNITVLFWKKVFGVPTGVKDPISSTYRMYSVNGSIIVEGVTTGVAVYDINGRLMQQVRAKGTFISRPLQPGIYILRVDNLTQKVPIR